MVILRNMKTAVSLPDPLFEAAERLAARLGLSRSGLYAAAIEEFVESRRREAVTEALDEVYQTPAVGALDPAWVAAQAEIVAREDET